MTPLDHINPLLPTPKTRDGVLDAFIGAIRERIADVQTTATSDTMEELPILVHMLAELLGAAQSSKAEVGARIAELKAIPDDDEQVHLRDASLAILKKVGIALNKQD